MLGQTPPALDGHLRGPSWGHESFARLCHYASFTEPGTVASTAALTVSGRFRGRGHGLEAKIWILMCTICLTHIWSERKDAVCTGEQTSVCHSVARFWTDVVRQLTALAKKDHRDPDTVVQRAVLHTCLDLFTLEPRNLLVPLEISHGSSPSPVLLSWLRSFQTSST